MDGQKPADQPPEVLWVLRSPNTAQHLIALLWRGKSPLAWRLSVERDGKQVHEVASDDERQVRGTGEELRREYRETGWTETDRARRVTF